MKKTTKTIHGTIASRLKNKKWDHSLAYVRTCVRCWWGQPGRVPVFRRLKRSRCWNIVQRGLELNMGCFVLCHAGVTTEFRGVEIPMTNQHVLLRGDMSAGLTLAIAVPHKGFGWTVLSSNACAVIVFLPIVSFSVIWCPCSVWCFNLPCCDSHTMLSRVVDVILTAWCGL